MFYNVKSSNFICLKRSLRIKFEIKCFPDSVRNHTRLVSNMKMMKIFSFAIFHVPSNLDCAEEIIAMSKNIPDESECVSAVLSFIDNDSNIFK